MTTLFNAVPADIALIKNAAYDLRDLLVKYTSIDLSKRTFLDFYCHCLGYESFSDMQHHANQRGARARSEMQEHILPNYGIIPFSDIYVDENYLLCSLVKKVETYTDSAFSRANLTGRENNLLREGYAGYLIIYSLRGQIISGNLKQPYHLYPSSEKGSIQYSLDYSYHSQLVSMLSSFFHELWHQDLASSGASEQNKWTTALYELGTDFPSYLTLISNPSNRKYFGLNLDCEHEFELARQSAIDTFKQHYVLHSIEEDEIENVFYDHVCENQDMLASTLQL